VRPRITENWGSSMFAVRSAYSRALGPAPRHATARDASVCPALVSEFHSLRVPLPLLFGDHFSQFTTPRKGN
jgi:hypothetical protein